MTSVLLDDERYGSDSCLDRFGEYVKSTVSLQGSKLK